MLVPMIRNFSLSGAVICRTTRLLSTQIQSENAGPVVFNKLLGADKGIALYGFNSRKDRNALSNELVQCMREVNQLIRNDTKISVVILYSMVPGIFCAGANLKERFEMDDEEVAKFVRYLRGTLTEIEDLPMPTIAAVEGVAVGGGLELALACDIRVAADTAKLGLVETSRGLLPGAGGTQRLPRAIHLNIAKELIFTSRIVKGKEARELGIPGIPMLVPMIRNFSLSGAVICRTTRLLSTQIQSENAGPVVFNKLLGADKGIALYGFNSRKDRNALSNELVQCMREVNQLIRNDTKISVVILYSMVPGIFCAGANLKERFEMDDEEVAKFVRYLRGTLTEIEDLPMPTIAAVEGVAVGGGLELALACDIRVAADTAKLGLVETSRGLLPGAGGTQRLPRAIHLNIAKELIFTSRIVKGKEARELGIPGIPMLVPMIRNFSLSGAVICRTTRLLSTQIQSENAGPVVFNKLLGADKGIALYGFNSRKDRNALSNELVQCMREVNQLIRNDTKISVVILYSMVPGIFCAGANLKERFEMDDEEVAKFVRYLRGTLTEIEDLPMPTIAAVEGVAVGGGLELALACDIRVAADTAKLGLVETSRGLLPGAGGTQRLPRAIHLNIAKELIFTSRIVKGKEARELGIVNHVVPQNGNNNAALEKALEIAREIIVNAPIALRCAKQAINEGIQLSIKDGYEVEQKYYQVNIPTKDRKEGMISFIEKRKPVYEGH